MNDFIETTTVIGSLLGAFAFLQNQLHPIFEQNKIKWNKLNTEIISEIDLKNIHSSISNGSVIPSENETKLHSLANVIKINSELIQFKDATSRYKQLLKNILDKYEEYIQLTQVPYWDTHTNDFRLLNKEFFYKNAKSNADYNEAKKRCSIILTPLLQLSKI